jgi:hypothetical protein
LIKQPATNFEIAFKEILKDYILVKPAKYIFMKKRIFLEAPIYFDFFQRLWFANLFSEIFI